jgi:post-segregation antitoxin (ccd killing protein)
VNRGVYSVCMSRVNIYLPDDLARRAREARLNVSGIAQAALERELRVQDLAQWLEDVRSAPPLAGVSHEEAVAALDEVRAEAGDEFPPGYDLSDP